jgi:hypothetical protein
VQRNEGVVGESAAPVGGGGFVSIASDCLSNHDASFGEAGDFGYEQLKSLASMPSM